MEILKKKSTIILGFRFCKNMFDILICLTWNKKSAFFDNVFCFLKPFCPENFLKIDTKGCIFWLTKNKEYLDNLKVVFITSSKKFSIAPNCNYYVLRIKF